MFDFLKILVSKTTSNKFIRKGKCRKCGNCCRNITFIVDDKFIRDEKEFEEIKQWNKYYNNFFITGQDERGVLLFTCKSLRQDNTCSVYWLRASGCREYPKVNKNFLVNGGRQLDGCGFYFEPQKKFDDYLK